MADQQQFFLKWNDFQSNMVSSFRHLRDEKSFTDVTLACEGQTCKAHKMVLSACSPYFKSLLEVSESSAKYIFTQKGVFWRLKLFCHSKQRRSTLTLVSSHGDLSKRE